MSSCPVADAPPTRRLLGVQTPGSPGVDPHRARPGPAGRRKLGEAGVRGRHGPGRVRGPRPGGPTVEANGQEVDRRPSRHRGGRRRVQRRRHYGQGTGRKVPGVPVGVGTVGGVGLSTEPCRRGRRVPGVPWPEGSLTGRPGVDGPSSYVRLPK